MLSHPEIQMETCSRFCLTLVSPATTKETTKHAVEDVTGKEEPLFTASWSENWYSHYGLDGVSPRKDKRNTIRASYTPHRYTPKRPCLLPGDVVCKCLLLLL